VVSPAAIVANASEAGPSSGTFAITRTSAGVPLTVNYTLSGSASNGVDYVTLPGSVTFDASQTTTNITVTPLDDSIPETTENVILSVNPSSDYVGAGSATVTISDNESPQLTINAVDSQGYESSFDYARYRITRLGDTNSVPFAVNVTFSGTATLNTDFTVDPAVTFNPGDERVTFAVHPIEDTELEGNETIIATLAPASGGEYTIGTSNSAAITLVDAATPPETVLFSDNFDTDTTANWNLLFAAAPDATPDYIAMFNYDYASFNGIPAAPHSNGDTHGLYLAVNKNDATAAAAALNLYPIGKSFSGNFALRFDMFLINSGGASVTEYALFGVNHSGNLTNWFRNDTGGVGTGWTFDGVFYDIEADGAASGDYVSYSAPTTAGNNPTALSSTNASALTGVFKSPPWAVAGAPSNLQGTATPMWAEVEISQLNNVVTLKVNKTVILTQNNTTGFTAGNVMLGYEDAYDSIGTSGSAVIYDNVRVVALVSTEVHISKIQKVGANIQIDFTAEGAVAGDFTLDSSADVAGTYTDAGATIISTGGNNYRATVAVNGNTRFYRIHRH
jgi:Calx-beta domain-containing protein